MTAAAEFRDRCRLIFLPSGGSGLILALGAFFDDSGTHANSKLVCWGGFIGTAQQWKSLDVAWRAKLDNPGSNRGATRPPLKKFALADCRARTGEFQDYSEPECDALRYDFRKIISDAGVIGVSFSIDRIAYDRLVVSEKAKREMGEAEGVCFAHCFRGARDLAKQFYPDEKHLATFFDRVAHRGRLDMLASWVDQALALYGQEPKVGSVSFEKVEDWTPLQAADIIATENYWSAQRFLVDRDDPGDAHWQSFKNLIQSVGYLLNETQIKEALSQFGLES